MARSTNKLQVKPGEFEVFKTVMENEISLKYMTEED